MNLKAKYLLLLISFIGFCIIGVIVHIEHIKADEYAKFDGSLQAEYKALNLEIIDTIYFPFIVVSFLILFIVLKFYGKRISFSNRV